MHAKVINPTFEPSVEEYAKAMIFSEDYFNGERKYIVTSKPYLWALALQRIRFEELSLEKSKEVIKKAKELRESRETKKSR
jgi:hypothetical protein